MLQHDSNISIAINILNSLQEDDKVCSLILSNGQKLDRHLETVKTMMTDGLGGTNLLVEKLDKMRTSIDNGFDRLVHGLPTKMIPDR